MVRHLCLKFNTIASPLNPPKRAGKDSPVSLYWGWWIERGQVNLSQTGEVGAILYGGYIYFTSILVYCMVV